MAHSARLTSAASSLRRPAQRGFSLLEVLVAFSILALSLGVTMQIFSNGLRNVEISRDQARALALAQASLATAGSAIPLRPGETRGEFPPPPDPLAGRYRWRLSILPFQEAGEGRPPPRLSSVRPPVQLLDLRVTVEWEDGQRGRSLTLRSTRIQAQP